MEKLKAIGLRHGEKIVVALASVICLVLVVMAAGKKTIDMTPEQVKEAANAARQNIDRRQDEKEILEKLAADGLKDAGFVQIVQQRETQEATVDAVALTHPFTYPDPGAGLIRDAVELIAPTDLIARASRGGIHVFALDESGNRIPEEPADPKKAAPKSRLRNPSLAMSSGSYTGGVARRGGTLTLREAEAKKEAERAEQRKRAAVAGLDPNAPEATDEATTEEVPSQEVTQGFRWVALTGVLDYKVLRENYAKALRVDFGSAYPNFVRLDVERQESIREVDWSGWEPVDREANQRVFDNLTEQDDDEWTPPEVRLQPLVQILPFLRAGYWTGVHHIQLVPKERLAKPKPLVATEGMSGESGSYMQSMQMQMQGTAGETMAGGSGSMGMMGGSGEMTMPGGPLGGIEDTNFPKSEAEKLMVRTLDFSVEPDTSYRYRVRIVVRNPNQNRGDVTPGVDNSSAELFGPWSEETDAIRVAPDITVYAKEKALAVGQTPRDDLVDFEVARWNPEDGVTVVRSFPAGPGQLVGDPINVPVPVEGEKPKPKLIDFNSRQLVVDTSGGMRPISMPGVTGAMFDVPAVATVLRPDGTVVVRNEASDVRDPEMLELKEAYNRAIRDAGQKRPAASGYYGSGGEGMMPGSSGP